LKSVTGADPSSGWNAMRLAALLAEIGDPDGYHKQRQVMLARFGATKNPTTAEQTAKACLVLPATGKDLENASRLADLSVMVSNGYPFLPYCQFAKGLRNIGRAASTPPSIGCRRRCACKEAMNGVTSRL